MTILDTGVKIVRNVGRFTFGDGAVSGVADLVASKRSVETPHAVFLIDDYFKNEYYIASSLGAKPTDAVHFVSTVNEPSTQSIDELLAVLHKSGHNQPATIVGFGGGITLDTAKAVSNLLTNGGRAADYQGWDLVRVPGVHKIGVPTISGTGSEATRTCVMTNLETGLKLGMNSDFTVFDHVVLDPSLTRTVPRNQYFYTGMDAYIHCIEALAGSYRNAIGDA